MNQGPIPSFNELPEDQMLRIDALCARFDAECRKQPELRVETFLPEIRAEDVACAVLELIQLEAEIRLGRGESLSDTEYPQRFPQISDSWLSELLQSLRGRMTQDTQPLPTVPYPAGVRPEQSWRSPSDCPTLPRSHPERLMANRRLGDYRILDRLGSGGMGTVYRAVHEQMGRMVALKVLRPDVAQNDILLRRFQREMQTGGQLKHPHIVTVYDAREHDGLQFLIMELVEGPDFETLVRSQGPLRIAEATDVIVQAARGLDYAHRLGIIHRDVKPANLLRDSAGVVRILDLGLAKLWNPEETSPLTETGMVMGTLSYMAPEQARNIRAADARSDIYSLGCTFYYLLNGKIMFPAESALDALLIRSTQPPPQLTARLGRVPDRLNDIFQKMVAPRPAQRYQNAAELLTALEGSRNSVTSRAQPAATAAARAPRNAQRSFRTSCDRIRLRAADCLSILIPSRFRKLSRRHQIVTAGVAAGLCLLAALPLVIPLSDGNSARSDSQAKNSAALLPADRTAGSDERLRTDAEQKTGQTSDRWELVFDGRSSFVALSSLAARGGGPVTLEAIVRPYSFRTSNLISWLGSDWMALYLSADGRWGLARRLGTESLLVTMTNPVVSGQQMHVAGVLDGSDLRLFVDGVPVETSVTQYTLPDTDGGLYVGGVDSRLLPEGEQDRYFHGAISAVRISLGRRYEEVFTPPGTLDVDSRTLVLLPFEEGAGQSTVTEGKIRATAVLINTEWMAAAHD